MLIILDQNLKKDYKMAREMNGYCFNGCFITTILLLGGCITLGLTIVSRNKLANGFLLLISILLGLSVAILLLIRCDVILVYPSPERRGAFANETLNQTDKMQKEMKKGIQKGVQNV